MLILRAVTACAVSLTVSIAIAREPSATAAKPGGKPFAEAVAKGPFSANGSGPAAEVKPRRPQLPRLELGSLDLGSLRVSPAISLAPPEAQRAPNGPPLARRTTNKPKPQKRVTGKPVVGELSMELASDPSSALRSASSFMGSGQRRGGPLSWMAASNDEFAASNTADLGLSLTEGPNRSLGANTQPLRQRQSMMFRGVNDATLRLNPLPSDEGVSWIAPQPGTAPVR
ncbi:MAG: hypothetical protein AAFV43_10595 [Planctomycetota bacterium]